VALSQKEWQSRKLFWLDTFNRSFGCAPLHGFLNDQGMLPFFFNLQFAPIRRSFSWPVREEQRAKYKVFLERDKHSRSTIP
jgi:hypothetical protein